MSRALNALRQSLPAFRGVFASADLRRVQLALAASTVGYWAYGVAVAVYAFREDGAYAVGVLALVRWLVAAGAAPLTGALADRHPRRSVMAWSDFVRAGGLAAMAVAVVMDGPSIVVYALAVVVTVASTAFRPAQAALLPSLAREPGELVAANVVGSTIESVGLFFGPALGGLLLAVGDASVVFAVTTALFVWSGILVGRVSERGEPPERTEAARPLAEAAAGLRTIAADARLALLVGLFSAQTLVDGALSVLTVLLAFEVLEIGDAGVGFLNSAGGVGGIVGAVVAAALVGRSRLASDFGAGMVLWGAPLVVIGVWPNTAVAIVALAVVGVGNTLVDVAGGTLLQRSVPDAVLARAFGALQGLMLVTVAVGSVAAPLLADLVGTRAAFVLAGALLPVLALATRARLRSLDVGVPHRELALLRAIPLLTPLPPATLEQLAGRAVPHDVAAGETAVRQGDVGDRFYVVRDGELAATVDGVVVARLGRGDFFGEIALLRDVPRTATVTATTEASLLTLDRDVFVAAVTGHADSARAADAVIGARLAAPRSRVAVA